MTPTVSPTTFPLDGILTCGPCGCAMALRHNPLPQYACQNSCDVPVLQGHRAQPPGDQDALRRSGHRPYEGRFHKADGGRVRPTRRRTAQHHGGRTTYGRADPRVAGRPTGHPATRVHERRTTSAVRSHEPHRDPRADGNDSLRDAAAQGVAAGRPDPADSSNCRRTWWPRKGMDTADYSSVVSMLANCALTCTLTKRAASPASASWNRSAP